MNDLMQNYDRHEAERESDGFFRGVAVAIVTDNRDPDGQSRLRVRFPWQPDAQASFWGRLAVPMSGNDRGTYFLPEVGDEVLVAFERGDQEHPFVIGSLWNGQAAAPENNADGNNDHRLIRSRSGHELRFNDNGSSPEVELKLEDGKHLKLDRNGVTLEDGKGNALKIDTTGGSITIESKVSLTLRAPQISIDADATLSLSAGADVSIQGALVRIN